MKIIKGDIKRGVYYNESSINTENYYFKLNNNYIIWKSITSRYNK